jgi:tRNA pseudouridine55 synthase
VSKTPQASRPKIAWRDIDGVLLLDKPLGISSNDALQKARRLFRAAKGGHTGTLDPLASGLLPLCFGEATKFSHDLLDAAKTYETTLTLGITTSSGDVDGEVIAERPVDVSEAQVRQAAAFFLGDILQVPPMHSALKRNGVPLYKLARQGIEVERAARPVTIHAIDVVRVNLPQVQLRVCCSKGTYIRTLGMDIGERLGCGAHLSALRRSAVAALSVGDAVTLEAIAEAVLQGNEMALLQRPDTLVSDLPALEIDPVAYVRFSHGNAVSVSLPGGDRFRVYSPSGLFLGVALRAEDGRLQPQRLIKTEGL